MAVNPTPPRDTRIGSAPQRKLLPPPGGLSEAGAAARSQEAPQQQRPGLIQRLRTAVTDDEIDGQIMRMFKMIAQGLINLAAPRGSYLNILT